MANYKYYKRYCSDIENVENFEEVSGKGIQYQYEGKTIKIVHI